MKAMIPDARHGEAGFTLIEILVALTLMSIMTALIADTLGNARAALDFLARADNGISTAPVASYLRAVLSEASSSPPESGSARPIFAGTASSISFSTYFSTRGQVGGVYQIQLSAEPSFRTPGAFNLVVRQTPERARRSGEAGSQDVSVFIQDAREISFRYAGRDKTAAFPKWSGGWTENSRLPHLVMIDIRFSPGDPRSWTPLVVAIAGSDSHSLCPGRKRCQ